MCDLYSGSFFLISFLVVLVIAVSLAIKKNQTFYKNTINEQKGVVEQSLLNQKEMISLLKEIRDLLKK